MPKKSRKRASRPVSPSSSPPALRPTSPPLWQRITGDAFFVPGLLVALCAGLYAWTLDFPMVFDDDTYLINNPFFRADSFAYPAHFTDFVQQPGKLGLDPDLAVNFVTRPVAYATFYANRLLGGWDTHGYRLVNILIHLANSVLLWALLRQLLRRSGEENTPARGTAEFVPACAAVLFAVHPLAVESVTYIVQRFTSLAAFWCLLALWLHFKSLQEGEKRVLLLRTTSVMAMVLGMLTKECSVVTPLLAVMLDVLVLGTRWKAAAWRSRPLLFCLPLIPILVLLCAAALHGGFDISHGLNIVNSRDEPLPHLHFIFTQLTVVAHYLRLLVWPSGQNLDPEWPVFRSLMEGPVLMALAVHAGILLGAWWLGKRPGMRDSASRLPLAFTLWFYLSISISSGLVPLPDMVAEHRTYLPSAGMFVLVAVGLDQLVRMLPRAAWTACVLIIGTLFVVTIERNRVWSTSESLWRDTAAKSPGKFRVWSNLGVALVGKGRDDLAVNCFRKSVDMKPEYATGVVNLSNSLLRLRRPQEALTTIQSLEQSNPEASKNHAVSYTRALGLFSTGKIDESVALLRRILEETPDYSMAHRLLGIIFDNTGRIELAMNHYQEASRLNPLDASLQKALKVLEQKKSASLR